MITPKTAMLGPRTAMIGLSKSGTLIGTSTEETVLQDSCNGVADLHNCKSYVAYTLSLLGFFPGSTGTRDPMTPEQQHQVCSCSPDCELEAASMCSMRWLAYSMPCADWFCVVCSCTCSAALCKRLLSWYVQACLKESSGNFSQWIWTFDLAAGFPFAPSAAAWVICHHVSSFVLKRRPYQHTACNIEVKIQTGKEVTCSARHGLTDILFVEIVWCHHWWNWKTVH